MSATEQELGELHGILARKLKDIISEGVTVQSGEGTSQVTAGAAYFAVAAAVLKNNNVTASKDNEALKGLREKLAEKRAAAKTKITSNSIHDAERMLEKELGDMGMGGFIQ